MPPWPLRIVWWRVFEPIGSHVTVRRAPSPAAPTADWERLKASPISRPYFPRTQRRWQRIHDAILKRRESRSCWQQARSPAAATDPQRRA